MRITVTLDTELVTDAKSYTGIENNSAFVREALKRLIHIEASRRLAKRGGTMPDLRPIPRRR